MSEFYQKLDQIEAENRIKRIFENRPENLHDYQGCANDPTMKPQTAAVPDLQVVAGEICDEMISNLRHNVGKVEQGLEGEPEKMCICGHSYSEHNRTICFGTETCKHEDCDGCEKFTREHPDTTELRSLKAALRAEGDLQSKLDREVRATINQEEHIRDLERRLSLSSGSAANEVCVECGYLPMNPRHTNRKSAAWHEFVKGSAQGKAGDAPELKPVSDRALLEMAYQGCTCPEAARSSWSCEHCRAIAELMRFRKSQLSSSREIREKLENLVNKLELLHADTRYAAVWHFYAVHGAYYTGPQYTDELAEAKQALALLPAMEEKG